MRWRSFQAITFILSILLSVTCKAENLSADFVFDTGNEIPVTYRHFTQVMGSDKLEFAKKRFACFRKTNPEIPVALVSFPVPIIKKLTNENGEYPRPRFPYSVVVASYASATEAMQALYLTRKKIKLNALFECLHFNKTADDKDAFKNQFYTYELRTSIKSWPKLLARSPLASFDGIGYTKNAYAPNKDTSASIKAVVKGRIYTNTDQVKAELSGIQSLYPELHFAAINQGGYYYVTPGANTSGPTLDETILQMRRRGLYEFTYIANISTEVTARTKQDPPALQGLPGQKTEFDTAPDVKVESRIEKVSILEMEDLVSPIQERVKLCVKQIKPNLPSNETSQSSGTQLELGIPLDKFSACSGVVLDNVGITRCLLESNCAGIRVPINWDIPASSIAKECIVGPDSTCAGTTLDPLFLEIARRAHIGTCINNPASKECADIKANFNNICEDPANQSLCSGNTNLANSFERRMSEVLRCIGEDHCDHIIPRPPGIEETIRSEISLVKERYDQALRPVKEGIAFISKPAEDLAKAFKECKKLAETDKAGSEVCYAKLALSPSEQEALKCFKENENSDQSKCFINDPKVTEIVSRAQCFRDAAGNPIELAKCAGLNEGAEIEEKYKCAVKESSALQAVAKCSNFIPPAVTETLNCVGDSGNSTDKLVKCIPGQTTESKAVICLATSKSDSERMSCITEAVPMDANARKALSCAAASNGDSQAAARCAVGELVTGDLGKALACGSTATGAVDFALCVAGPQMNPELRMAAECAASTGGEPITFATCTAGRLTIAELTKCLSGEIGKEGGCFGPNNTIVLTLTNAFNDMTRGLGENNEITIAYRQLGDIGKQLNNALTDIGRGIGKAAERIVDDLRRSDIGKAACNIGIC